jgi:hypothetical protein
MSEKKHSGSLGREGKLLSYWIGKLWLRLFGWKIHGETPRYRKFVFIAAPHTSDIKRVMAAQAQPKEESDLPSATAFTSGQ